MAVRAIRRAPETRLSLFAWAALVLVMTMAVMSLCAEQAAAENNVGKHQAAAENMNRAAKKFQKNSAELMVKGLEVTASGGVSGSPQGVKNGIEIVDQAHGTLESLQKLYKAQDEFLDANYE